MEFLRAVLFDYGGVFTGTPLKAFREAAPEYGLTAQALTDLILGPTEYDTGHPWHRLERGEVAAVDAVAEIMQLALDSHGIAVDPWKVLVRTGRAPEDRLQMVRRVQALRAVGLQTALVTNNFREAAKHWRSSIPLDELFDTVVDSSEVGVRKPDPRIYELTAKRLVDVDPEHCAFLDDLAGNVAGAESVGMTGVLVDEDKTSTLAWLDTLVEFRSAQPQRR